MKRWPLPASSFAAVRLQRTDQPARSIISVRKFGLQTGAMNQIRSFTTTASRLAKKGAQTTKPKYLGRVSNNLSLGVVGLANVGKSTFFQAITKSTLGNPANYPYATIDPSMSLIVVESSKLDHLQRLYGSAKKVPTSMTIYDIAGLTRNAALGEGLGNKFLADIRQVDGVFHVVRGFRDDEITHIEHNVDPVRDMTIVTDELILKDLDYIEIGLEQAQKALKKPQADKGKIQFEIDTLNKVLELLYLGRKVSTAEWSNEEIDIINPLNLLTAKPTVVLLNVNEGDYQNDSNEFKEAVEGWIQENCPEDELMLFSAAYETQLNEKRDNVEELEAYKAEHGHKGSAMSGIVDKMRSALRLVSFYTCGPKEAHQWTVRDGSLAPEAAGAIHTDLQKPSFQHRCTSGKISRMSSRRWTRLGLSRRASSIARAKLTSSRTATF